MFHPTLKIQIEQLLSEFEKIPENRKSILQNLATYINKKKDESSSVLLNFICTHNSRRSHISQIWAATAAAYFGLEDIFTYSGGTEATAFNPRAVAGMKRIGFRIASLTGENPVYQISFSETSPRLEAFSKEYDHPHNPQKDFAAIMTCSHADENCPFIPGAVFRLSLPYNDPKEADGTERESQVYDERIREIGREIFYAMSLVSKS